jgi:adenylate cyclase
MMSGEDPAFGLTMGRVRKLAALLSADVEGYSRLMGVDEAATVHTLTVYRAVIQTFVQQHRGRVVDSPGDNLLAEFASVVDAVQCAVAIQRELSVRNTALPLQRRMKFRIGINLGDVIVDGERIYGDGVNIAARLESLAEGGGICIAGSVYEQVKTKLALGYEDMGLQAVKNIAEPVRVYRMREEPRTTVALGSQRTPRAPTLWRRRAMIAVGLIALVGGGVGIWQLVARPLSPWPTKPSIAVLPFVNMSGDSEQEYFSDGMTEDLITELSRLDGLMIIARNSAFTYKGKAVKPEQVSRELGVRYMLEGRVRKANNRIRITVQLVDGTTGYHVWAQSYDRDSNDIFAVQGEIARMITRALEVRLTMAEEKHIGSPYTTSAQAWELFMRGTERYRRFTPKDNAEARVLFEKAIALDRKFARAYANLAATHRQDWILAWTQNRDDSERLAYENAEKAVELAREEPEPKPSLPYALEQRGFVELYKEHLEAASAAAKEALSRSPNYADGYALAAHVLIFQGKPDEALQKTQEAINLDPKYPFFYDYHRGHAHYVWGVQTLAQNPDVARRHFEEAETHLRTALQKNRNFRPTRAYLVAVLSELGRQQEAVREMATYRNMGGSSAARILPYKDPAITRRLIQTWQAAERGS